VSATLEISDVTVAFGGNVVLDRLSLSVSPGFTGLIGPNGAGKTTCLNAISGYVRPSHGDVRLRGVSVLGEAPHRIAARGLSRTFQTPRLVAGISALDNVLLGGHRHHRRGHLAELLGSRAARRTEEAQRERARELLARFGLDRVATRPAGAFPIGSQKIVEVARGLLNDPVVLLLDEPAAGLGAEDVDTLIEGLGAYLSAGGTSVVIIEHDLKLITRLCPRAAVLHFGRIIRQGRPADILNDEQVVEAYLGAGFAADR
jgi:branched-chain amino acid transport system ATP-binding protein